MFFMPEWPYGPSSRLPGAPPRGDALSRAILGACAAHFGVGRRQGLVGDLSQLIPIHLQEGTAEAEIQ
jgi:hypothetical protein